MKHYDCIVVGIGGVGSASLLAAAKEGWKVLGLDQFGAANERGSSHGHTRAIRTAYFEHPNYVPLAQRAIEKWRLIEAGVAKRLMELCGVLQMGPESSEVIQGTLESIQRFGLDHESLSSAEIQERFPMFRVVPDHVGIFERNAGFLYVEKCVAAMTHLAQRAGAEVRANARVEGWQVLPDQSVKVVLSDETIACDRFIIAGGAWMPELLGTHCGKIQVLRKTQHWYQVDRVDIKHKAGFPVYLIESERGVFYGIPEIGHLGMKIGEHSGGEVVSNPTELVREVEPERRESIERFIDEHFNIGRKRLVHESVCMYSMSEDGHFVVDHYPQAKNVVFAAGLSGHGFKFSNVIGEELVRMLKGEPDPLYDFLRVGSRFGIEPEATA